MLILLCLNLHVKASHYSKGGSYFGRLQSTNHINVQRQRKQAALADSEFSLELAKNIVSGKIHNQEIILRRYARSEDKDVKDFLVRMRQSLKKIGTCESVSEIMGD